MAVSATTWSDILPDLLGRVIARLPFPAGHARLRAVCRGWHSAARQHVRQQLPWIVLPDCSFCTIGDDGEHFQHRIIPGLPDDEGKATACLGATGPWLALDCTDDVFRRTPHWDKFSNNMSAIPRPDVKHKHTYLLHNPFSGETVPLPELDSIIGNVAETFEIRKVLMRSGCPDDLIAITTNNWNCNVILCRPGKGKCVVPDLRVFDVVFLGDQLLYGITPEEELVAVDIEDEAGSPTVTKCKRVIKKPLGADGWDDPWSWMYDDVEDDNNDDDSSDDGQLSASSEEEEEAGSDDDHAPNQEEEDASSFNGDDMVPNGVVSIRDEQVPYEPKDYIRTFRYLVKSRSEELLLVRHHVQVPPRSSHYTRNVEVFKADISAGNWALLTSDAIIAKGEALFLSRSSCNYTTLAYGDVQEGLIYFIYTNEVFDITSWAPRPFILPKLVRREAPELLTWLFPPQLVV